MQVCWWVAVGEPRQRDQPPAQVIGLQMDPPVRELRRPLQSLTDQRRLELILVQQQASEQELVLLLPSGCEPVAFEPVWRPLAVSLHPKAFPDYWVWQVQVLNLDSGESFARR